MKVAIIGLGSIGQRHLKNICYLLKNQEIRFSVDALRQTNKTLPEEISRLLGKQYFCIDEMPNDYDVIFIANPTVMHYETLQYVLNKTRHVFIEKPLFHHSNYDLKQLPLKKGSVYYVACPLRYTKVIEFLREYVQNHQIYSVRSICSSYLPDWRDNVDYRSSYSAQKKQGGGVAIDLIHEWDYICHLFGFPEKVFTLQGKYSHLEISSEDMSVYIGQYPDKLISLHLDYFGRKTRREIELYCQEDVVIGDLVLQQIRFLRSGEVVDFSEVRDDYQKRELSYFFRLINVEECNQNDLEYAMKVLKIAEGRYSS